MDFLEAANRWAESQGFVPPYAPPSFVHSAREHERESLVNFSQTARAVAAATAASASASAAAGLASARLTSPTRAIPRAGAGGGGAGAPALTLAEAAERTVAAEARADALQGALDRYALEGEALEVSN